MQEKDKITSAQQKCFTNVLELHTLFWLREGKQDEKGHTAPCLSLLV